MAHGNPLSAVAPRVERLYPAHLRGGAVTTADGWGPYGTFGPSAVSPAWPMVAVIIRTRARRL